MGFFSCYSSKDKSRKMGRMHAPGKGISQSALPYRRSVPNWLKLTSDEVKEHIFKLAKKGLTPSQIGVILRDSHGVAQVRFVTGNKILRILKAKGLAPDLPEDIYHLIKKAVSIRKHLEKSQRQGFQVSLHLGGKPHSSLGTLLQDQGCFASHLEIRFRHRFCPGLVIYYEISKHKRNNKKVPLNPEIIGPCVLSKDAEGCSLPEADLPL